MDFPSEELPTVSLFRSLLHPACISSVLFVIDSLGHHRPSCSTLRRSSRLFFLFLFLFLVEFSFEAPEALNLPISSAAASVVTLVTLLACTGTSTIVSFSSYGVCLCHENLYWYRSFSHLLHLHLTYVPAAAAAVAISSSYQNCLQRLWQCHWESCEAKKTSYQERIFHTLCEAEMIQTLWSSLWFAIW